MAETATRLNDYISQDMFDLQIKHLRERADSDEKLSNARIELMQAFITKAMAEQNTLITDIKGEMKAINERMDKNLAEYKVLLSNVRSELKDDISEVRGDVKAINARFDTLQNKFSWNL